MKRSSTRPFSDSIKEDLQTSVEFRRGLLSEAIAVMTSGDIATGKIVLREYINGTIGFPALGAAIGRSPKSIMRMLGPKGNPQLQNFFQLIAHLQKIEGVVLRVQALEPNVAEAA